MKNQFLASTLPAGPLNAVIGFATLLEQEMQSTSKGQGFARSIRESRAPPQVINDILDLASRGGALDLKLHVEDVSPLMHGRGAPADRAPKDLRSGSTSQDPRRCG
jgi:signal transduction histidine kinase